MGRAVLNAFQGISTKRSEESLQICRKKISVMVWPTPIVPYEDRYHNRSALHLETPRLYPCRLWRLQNYRTSKNSTLTNTIPDNNLALKSGLSFSLLCHPLSFFQQKTIFFPDKKTHSTLSRTITDENLVNYAYQNRRLESRVALKTETRTLIWLIRSLTTTLAQIHSNLCYSLPSSSL